MGNVSHRTAASSVAAVLLSICASPVSAPAATSSPRAHLVPPPSLGADSADAGAAYFGLPPLGDVQVVTGGIDRGGDFMAPTDYPQERHVVYSPFGATYGAFYEWNEAGDFMIGAQYWAGDAGWSAASIPSELGVQIDAGRPSAHESDHGVMVAYHATVNGVGYDLWVNNFDARSGTWGESVQVSAAGGTFAFLERASDGTWMIGATGALGEKKVYAHTSNDDGATWSASLVAELTVDNWTLVSGAADPENGDLYLAYGDDADGDDMGDIVLHRSIDGGTSWSSGAIVAHGVFGGQKVEPSLVVDRSHQVHLVFQSNIVDDFAGGGLSGLGVAGIIGPPEYACGHFDGDQWIATESGALLDRAELAALPDSCGLSPTIDNIATDLLSGMPQLGIYRGEAGDRLFVAYGQPYMAVDVDDSWEICGPFQIFMQERDLEDGEGWSSRSMVSAISEQAADQGRNAIYVNTTHEVPGIGPGFLWSEMEDARPPADVMFARPVVAGPALQVSLNAGAEQIGLGELLPLGFRIVNPCSDARSFEAWVEGFDPGGAPYPDNPLFGPLSISLAAGESVSGTRFYRVPPDAEIGAPHRLCLSVGTHPGEVIDRSCAAFEVVP